MQYKVRQKKVKDFDRKSKRTGRQSIYHIGAKKNIIMKMGLSSGFLLFAGILLLSSGVFNN